MRVPLKIALIAALLVAASASSSWALIEQYLPDGMNVTMKFTNWDEGTLYDPAKIVPGQTYLHAGAPGYNPLYDLDALRASAGTITPVGGAAGEDSWGIFTLREIYNTDNPLQIFWSRDWIAADPRWVTSPFEITGIFFGEHDDSFYFDGTSQLIKGSDMNFAFFEDTAKNFPSPVTAPGIRVGNTYAGVTDGTPIWTGTSAPGSGDAAPYEFFTKFTPGTTATAGGNFVGVTGAVPTFGVGTQNGILDNLGGGINFKFQFTADTIGRGDWLLKSDDPVNVTITPELSSSALMLLGMLPIGMVWWRRKRG